MSTWAIPRREILRHPGRTLLTWLSVVIGVTSVMAVGLSTRSARQAYTNMYETITGRAALEIVGAGGTKLDAALREVVSQQPGVQAAVPVIQRNVVMYAEKGRAKLIALGIDTALDVAIRDYELVAGEPLSPRSGLLLDASLAESLEIEVGDRIKLLVRRGLVESTVKGLVKPRSGAGVAGGGTVLIPLAVAQSYFAAPKQLDRIQMILTEDADPRSVRLALEKSLPTGTEVREPATRGSLAQETMRGLENGLLLSTAFSLLAAIFIITNTFSMSVGQRRHELAVMRAVGATQSQIRQMILREAFLLGAAGTAAGVACGLVCANLLNNMIGNLLQTDLPTVQLRLLPVAGAIAFGFGASLLSAWLPASRAARLDPVEGMSGSQRSDIEALPWQMVAAGFAGTLIAIGMFIATLLGIFTFEYGVAALVLLLISAVLLLPLTLKPLTWLGESCLRRLNPVESRMARRQLLRHGGRTMLTLGVLFIAVATGLGQASSLMDNVADIRHWYQTAIVGDFFVRATMPDMETGLSAAVPETVGEEIENIPGVLKIASLRFLAIEVNGQKAMLVTEDTVFTKASSPTESLLTSGPVDLDRPTVILGSVLAKRLGVQADDSVELLTRIGPQQLPVSRIQNDYLSGGMTVYMQRPLAERFFDVEGVDAYIVRAEHSQIADVKDALAEISLRNGMMLQSYADLTTLIEGMMSGVVGSLWALLTLALLVASFGVFNMLAMNVLEQTRELGLLRAVGMTSRQVRLMVLSQAILLGIVGIIPGIVAGIAMSYLMNLATFPALGHQVEFTLSPWLVLAVAAAAFALVILASWLPASRAARIQPALSLRYE